MPVDDSPEYGVNGESTPGSGPDGSGDSSDGSPLRRRSVLKASAGAGITLGLAGCLGGLGGGSDEELLIGSPLPLSGPFADYGQNFQQTFELLVEQANDDGGVDGRTVEIAFEDTEGDPDTGRRAAQELIDDGADILSGNYSSGVALSISELAQRRGIIYQCVGGSNAITGEDCQPYVFNSGNSAVQQSVTMPYLLENRGGETVFLMISDYAWAHSYAGWNEEVTIPDNGGEVIGSRTVPLGTTDWSGPVSEARDAGADHIHFVVTGSDLVQGVGQAFEFGLQGESIVSAAAANILDVQAIGLDIMTHESFYPGGTVWYWEHDTAPSQEFSEAYREEFDEVPMNFAGCHWDGTWTVLDAVEEVGGTDPDQLRDALEDREFARQLWGVGERFRACDHRGTTSTMVVQAKKDLTQENVDNGDVYEILEYPEDPESVMRTCEETGCEM